MLEVVLEVVDLMMMLVYLSAVVSCPASYLVSNLVSMTYRVCLTCAVARLVEQQVVACFLRGAPERRGWVSMRRETTVLVTDSLFTVMSRDRQLDRRR